MIGRLPAEMISTTEKGLRYIDIRLHWDGDRLRDDELYTKISLGGPSGKRQVAGGERRVGIPISRILAYTLSVCFGTALFWWQSRTGSRG